MSRLVMIVISVFIFENGTGQADYKQNETFSFNLLIGHQSFFNSAHLDEKLLANNFTKVSAPNLSFGIEFAAVGKKDVLKTQMRGTGLFVNDDTKEATLSSTTISLEYGRDLLRSKDKTFLYPFIGFRWFDHTLIGHSTDGKKLDAWKINFDFLFGIGLKQFLNSDLRGVFNDLDLSMGASLPVINGRWKEDGAEYVAGTFKLKSTWFLTFTIGRGFRPAPVR